MFCTNCGNQVDGNFCPICGKSIGGTKAAPLQRTESTNPPNSYNQNVQQPNPELCTLYFLPKKVIGQYMVSKAIIMIDGSVFETKFKKEIAITAQAGQHKILCHIKYMGQSCKAEITLNCEPNSRYRINYKSAIAVMMHGTINVERLS